VQKPSGAKLSTISTWTKHGKVSVAVGCFHRLLLPMSSTLLFHEGGSTYLALVSGRRHNLVSHVDHVTPCK